MNTHWDLKTEEATITKTGAEYWQVTLDVEALKLVLDRKDVETTVPLDDWIEVIIFAPS